MKLRLFFKTPDVLFHPLQEAGINPMDIPVEVQEVLDKYIQFGEHICVDIDLETGDATVVEA